jgi:tRNA-dihydrouridine synthase
MKNFWQDLPRPFFVLAPMEAVTDVVFRHVVAAAAPPDVWFTEFTNATGWVHAGQKAIGGRLVKTTDENPIVAQIWGGEPGDMEQLAKHCAELGFNGIDINMGCPAKSAVKSGGSALIRNPELAARSIAAAKTAGLPVSVKTRLGYTSIDEWRDWLTHILRQDVVNLTIHLRTKKEMSKVPAHHELISEIKKLRDEIAPHTLLTINGDIRDRAHGMELVEKYGVDGVMIGRGIFHDPFAFARTSEESIAAESEGEPAAQVRQGAGALDRTWREESPEGSDSKKTTLLGLLALQLDLHDQYNESLPRKFDPLKRFFKIYVRDFAGASELRDQLMHTKSTDEVRALLADKL